MRRIRAGRRRGAIDRVAELVAIGMVGEGMVAMIDPEGHMGLWRIGPLRKLVDPFLERPRLTRAIGVVELAAGLGLALWGMERAGGEQ